jgi:hypothetical protein
MAALSYGITFDLAAKLDFTQAINKQVFPMLHQAVRGVAKQTAIDWQTAVYKAKMWSGEKDAYAGSITWSMTGDFSAEVVAGYKYAADIETGRPARDLKRMLDTSMKVRRTTDGRRFLVIPFRHNTPGNDATGPSMPSSVHALAKNMEASLVTQQGERHTGQTVHLSPHSGMTPTKSSPFLSNPATKQHSMTAARLYQWGGRLTKSALKNQEGLTATQRKNMAGMVRFDTSTPGGKSKSSTYMTFRIMIEGSKGWIVPAQPGQQIAQKVVQEMKPKALAAFQEAIKRSLQG